MSDKPYTPTTEQIELLVLGQLKQSAEKRGIPVDVEADRADFRRWLATVEAAAEQRGAIKALREAADIKLGNEYYEMLVEDELNARADQIEGDE